MEEFLRCQWIHCTVCMPADSLSALLVHVCQLCFLSGASVLLIRHPESRSCPAFLKVHTHCVFPPTPYSAFCPTLKGFSVADYCSNAVFTCMYVCNILLTYSFNSFDTHIMFSCQIGVYGSLAASCSCVPTPRGTCPGLPAESHLLHSVPAASSVLSVEWGIR